MRTIIRDNYDPIPNEYHETIVVDEARGKRWLFDCDGIFQDITKVDVVSERGNSEEYAASQKWVTEEVEALEAADQALQDNIDAEEAGRIAGDTEIWKEIEAIEAASDVVDIVGTKSELESYDTSKLSGNDIIKVLQDETHDDATTYYRWNEASNTFTYIGAEGPYYTSSETDTLLADKQDKLIAGANIQIVGRTISATGAAATQFVGATASTDGTPGVVPAPLAGEQNKVLKGDGTWGDASAYALPPATTTTLGGIIVGDNLSIDSNGALSTHAPYTLPNASATTLGGIRVGNNLSIDSNGTLSATAYTAGDGINITDGVISSTAKGGTIVYGVQVERNSFVYLQFYLDSAKTDLITIDEMIGLLDAGSVVINTPLADSTTKNFYVVAYQYKETEGGTVLFFYTTEGSVISRYYTWADADQFDGAKQNLYWLQNKLSAGSNISIQGDTISATDTTYSDFVGTDGTTAGTSGLVPAPTTSDAGKFLKADGTWDTAGEAANNINSTDWNALWQ